MIKSRKFPKFLKNIGNFIEKSLISPKKISPSFASTLENGRVLPHRTGSGFAYFPDDGRFWLIPPPWPCFQ